MTDLKAYEPLSQREREIARAIYCDAFVAGAENEWTPRNAADFGLDAPSDATYFRWRELAKQIARRWFPDPPSPRQVTVEGVTWTERADGWWVSDTANVAGNKSPTSAAFRALWAERNGR